jgi:hypothetical protein
MYPQGNGVRGLNGTALGGARFSPIEAAGAIVPVPHAGSTLEVALMEVLWHDAPVPSQGVHFVLQTAAGPRRVKSVAPSAGLFPFVLTAIGLRRLGLARSDFVDSDATAHAATRRFSAWLYEYKPDAQGLCWATSLDFHVGTFDG